MTFKEFFYAQEASLRAINYKPGAQVPSLLSRNSGPEKMNPLGSVPPSKPYMPIFRTGSQAKTTVANRKH